MKLEQLKPKKSFEPIVAYGSILPVNIKENDDRIHANINYSEILSKLIEEAGIHCKAHASDLFILWQHFLNDVSKQDKDGTVTEYFGFRELGVDHESFIKVKLENEDVYGKDHYASIFRLDCSIHKEVVTMKLYQLK